MDVMFDDDIAKASLKQVANVPVTPIRVTGITTFEPRHEIGEVAVGRPHDQVEMILHLRARKQVDTLSLDFFDQDPQKSPAIVDVLEDSLLAVAAIHDVVDAAPG